jgi:hypothetical protein
VAMIALLDDDPSRLSAMREALAGLQAGHEVCAFDDAPQMIIWLNKHLKDCVLVSLDHDLGPNRNVDGEQRDPGTGRDVADYMAGQSPTCPTIIHTSNSMARVGMELVLREAGWTVLLAYPHSDVSWVHSSWLRVTRLALGQENNHDIYIPGAGLIAPISLGDASLLPELFALRTAAWKHPIQYQECYTIGLFDDLETAVPPSIAFELVPTAAAILLEQSDPELIETASALLAGLARKSDTTEMPAGLQTVWEGVCRACSKLGDNRQVYFDSVRDWYRKP